MDSTYTIDKETGYTCSRIHLSTTQASTLHTMELDVKVVVAKADSTTRDTHTKYPHSIALLEIGNDWTDEEELEWDSLLAQPHVQAGLNRLAKEAEQQFALGEIEEGGFAVE